MNLVKAVLLKLIAAFLFAMMSVLVRWVGVRYPVGQVVFFRSAFAIVPVVIIYAWRRELMAAIRIGRPWRHLGRGLTAVGAMFCNFSSLARLPVVDATAISVRLAAVHGGAVGDLPQGARAHLPLERGDRRLRRRAGDAVAASRRRPQRGQHGRGRRRAVRAGRRVLQRRLDGADPLARQERDHVVDRALLLAHLRGRRARARCRSAG